MGILRNLGLASLMVVGTLLPQGNLPASPSDASEKLLKINYRAASGNTEDFYSCLEDYKGFKMHCVRLPFSEGKKGANELILGKNREWYFTHKTAQGADIRKFPDTYPTYFETTFWTRKSPKGTLYYIPFNVTAQKSFRLKELTENQ